jgi:predicted porin
MNNTIKLAVASALLAAASTASAAGGIVAGDWTIDIGGNVNAYYINNNSKDSNVVKGGLANTAAGTLQGNTAQSINTGLLPSWLGFTGKTRQNDLDVEFAISLQPGASSKTSLAGGGGTENRQAYISFGDKSWGTILLGKNLGEFGRDAILLDQTLLGVGSQGVVGTAGGTTTTLGRIGTGFLYADFQGQMNYTTPNFNGFQAVVGVVQPINTLNQGNTAGVSAVAADTTNNVAATAAVVGITRSLDSTGSQSQPAFEAKASYSFAGDVSGKVWVEGKTQKVDYTATQTATAEAYAVGANVNAAGFGLVAYYYDAKGAGTTAWLMDGVAANGNKRKSNGGYVQGSFTVPGAGTKVAASWGISKLDLAAGETNTAAAAGNLVKENEMWTVGAYHPLTKHLNLVAEYSNVQSKNQLNAKNDSDILSAGAILFF